MNLDIQNIGHYRVTSHGGRAFVLFNREDDLVYNIGEKDYRFIMDLKTVSRCETVELNQLKKLGDMV
jgi:hypothetical protein